MDKYVLNFTNMKYFHTETIGSDPVSRTFCNSYYEIYYLIAGSVICRIEEAEFCLEADSILLIPPNKKHTFIASKNHLFERCAIFFNSDIIPIERQQLFQQTFAQDQDVHYYVYKNVSSVAIKHYFDAFEKCETMQGEFRNLFAYVALEGILSALIYHGHEKQKNIPLPEAKQQLNDILAYINCNLSSNLSPADICAKFYIDKNKLYQMFHESTNLTIKQYITCRRLAKATELIKQGVPLNNVALAVGYKNYSTFYRAYRKTYGISPGGTLYL